MSVASIPARLAPLVRMATPVLRAHGVRRSSVFGSVARGDAGVGSDVDLLVEMQAGLWGRLRLKADLEDALHQKVDVVPYDRIRSRLRPHILHEEIEIFHA